MNRRQQNEMIDLKFMIEFPSHDFLDLPSLISLPLIIKVNINESDFL